MCAMGLLLFAAGCSRGQSGVHPSPATPAPLSTTSAPGKAGTTSTRCHTSDLSLSTTEAGAAAGTYYRWVVLTNSSGSPCTLSGYPGVSLIDASGRQLGKPADRNPVHAPSVVMLPPGRSAYALVGFPNAANFPSGKCTASSSSMRVYPPDELRSLLTAIHEPYCPGFTVAALQATKQ